MILERPWATNVLRKKLLKWVSHRDTCTSTQWRDCERHSRISRVPPPLAMAA